MRHIRRTLPLALIGVLIGCQDDSLGLGPTNQPPTVTLEADPVEGQAPLQVKFTATAHDPDGDDLAYLWKRSRGSPFAGGHKYTHTFKTAGVHSLSVTVSDGEYEATAQVEVHVSAVPVEPPPSVPEPPDPGPPAPPEQPDPPGPPQQTKPVPYGGEWVWEFKGQYGFGDEGTISIIQEDPDEDDWKGSWGLWQSCFADSCSNQAKGVGFIGFAPVENIGVQLVIVLFEETLAGAYKQIYVGLDSDRELEKDSQARDMLWGEGYYSRYGAALFGDACAVLTDHPLTFQMQFAQAPLKLPNKPRVLTP